MSYSDYIKSPSEMGIMYGDSKEILENNGKALLEYSKALVSGDSTAFNIDNKKKPLGQRQFIKTESTCNANGNTVDKYIVIDNMKYAKNDNMELETKNYGLLSSAKGNLQAARTSGMRRDSNQCVEVKIETDADGTTDTKYISMDEYYRLDCTAFPKKCKKYGDNKDCDLCVEAFGNLEHHGMNHGMGHGMNHGMGHGMWVKDNNSYRTSYVNDDIYNKNIDEVIYVVENDKKQNIDLITSFYFGSITAIGLYIIYKFMGIHPKK